MILRTIVDFLLKHRPRRRLDWRPTAVMVYTGTFLLSVLSFFTTYYGLLIIVPKTLAAVGSLGLQSAMLGIAWNLMKIKSNRIPYLVVFSLAASFSIFFSYANFNSGLKAHTRAEQARAAYAEAARPVLAGYASEAKKALARGEYQVQRLEQLHEVEQTKGWATMIDEGSNDPVVQNVIDGARRTVESWRAHQGTDYRQGSGAGIIANYIATWTRTAQRNVEFVSVYARHVDSLALSLSLADPVTEQARIVTDAMVAFPMAAVAAIQGGEQPLLMDPPSPALYPEKPVSNQHALMLVLGDLLVMDHLTAFSLLFAFVIDFIVIVMALAGSLMSDSVDFVMNRVERQGLRRLRKLKTDDLGELERSLEENLARVKVAGRYGIELQSAINTFAADKRRLELRRGGERKDRLPDDQSPLILGPRTTAELSWDDLCRVRDEITHQ